MPFEGDIPVGLGDPILGGTAPTPRQAKDIGDSVIAGLQSSSMGLIVRGKLPEMQMPENAPWYHRVAAGVGGLVGDAPFMAGGAIAAAPTGPIGMGAASFAAPMAIREALTAAYSANHASSWEGLKDIALGATRGAVKGAIIGGATAGVGRFAAPLVAPTAGRAVLAGGLTAAGARIAVDTATVGAELATLTTTAAALDGKLPTAQDFMDNAILLVGMKGAVAVAKGLRGTYAATGKTPAEVAADAQANPAIAEALKAGEVPEAYAPLALEERIKAALDTSKSLTDTLEAAAKEGYVPKGDAVRYEYLTSNEAIQGVIRAVAQKEAERIEFQRRGVVPTQQSMLEAKALLEGGDLERQKIGEADSAHQAAARAILVRDAATNAKRLGEELANTPMEDRSVEQRLRVAAAVEQTALFYGELTGGVAEAARTVRMMGELKRNPELLGEAKLMLDAYKMRGKNIDEFAALLKTIENPDDVVRFSKEMHKATTMEKAIAVFRSFIYSGFRTHEANLMGNITKWVVDVPEATISASIYALQRKLAGDPLTMAQYKARALAPFIGWQLGAKDGVVAAWNVLRMRDSHYEKMEAKGAANTGPLGAFEKVVFGALQAEDMLFRIPGERQEAYIRAVDRTVKEGIHPETEAGQARITQFVNEPTLGLTENAAKEVTAAIYKAGAEAVYSERLGPRAEKLGQAISGSWAQFLVPAYRTPVNLVSYAMQHMPGLNLLSGRWRADYEAGGERQAKALARVTVGAGLAALAYTLTANGVLTGGGLTESPNEKNTKTGAGEQKYSLLIDGKYYNIERMEPVAKILMLAADLSDLWRALPDAQDKAKIALLSILAFGNATVSTTYLSGISKAMKAVTEPVLAANQFFEGYASALVPKIVGQTVEAFDPHKREVDGILDAIQSQTPFLRQKLMPKRDVWGEPVANDKWFDVMPVQVTQKDEDKVKTEAVRLHLAIADAPKFLLEKGPFKSKERKVDFTAEQRDVFRETMGHNAMKILAPIVNSPDWEQIPDFAKAAIYQKVFEGTRKQGQYAALPPEDAARVKLREKIVGEVLRQVQEANP